MKNDIKKILVAADSHNRLASLYDIVKLHRDASYVIHLGDYVRDAVAVEKQLGVNIIKIKANGDYMTNKPLKRILTIGGVKVLMVHGHYQNVKITLLRLKLLAQHEHVKLALFAHTHIQHISNKGGITYVNPGAAASGNYAIIKIHDSIIYPTLHKLK